MPPTYNLSIVDIIVWLMHYHIVSVQIICSLPRSFYLNPDVGTVIDVGGIVLRQITDSSLVFTELKGLVIGSRACVISLHSS